MPKSAKKQKRSCEKILSATLPWTSTDFGSTSEIDAYIEETGEWETIAETHAVGGVIDAEEIANFIVDHINEVQELCAVLLQISTVLENLCATKNLDRETKIAVEKALKYIGKHF